MKKSKRTTLSVKNLIKKFGDFTAVDSITFNAVEGEVIALLGPNGAGKSTLMNMLVGFLAPTKGSIEILGKKIEDAPMVARENIGFLPEGSPLYSDMTVKQFLNYMAELKSVSKDKLAEIIQKAKIEEVLNQKIETLSKGYQRRVGFAQSILSNPPILLLDEPTDGLDPNQKEHIRKLISEMGKEKTILISTHLLDEAETIADRIILINKGKIIADSTAVEIIKLAKA
ncbi:MAG: ABC transporter ATP-binding protein, partial [Lactobacillus sp.]|nr:ABC transporter ATP-binding protein [Lactobacillus sp.]